MENLLKSLLIVSFLSAPAFATSVPKESQLWQAWVEKARKSRAEKFAAPAITHSTYLKKVGDTGCIVLGGKYPRFKGKENCDFQIKWYKNRILTLKVKDKARASEIALEEPVELPGKTGMFVKAVEYPDADQFRIYLFDLNQKNLAKKRQRHFFAYDSAWVKTGKFKRMKKVTTVTIQRSDGSTKDLPVIGQIDLEIDKKPASLSIFDFTEGEFSDEKEFMLLYRDFSSGKKTYGAGRFLNIELPKAFSKMVDGDVVSVNFNYSYNPPCAVSTGFHCPLPQDVLPAKVHAGEKYQKIK